MKHVAKINGVAKSQLGLSNEQVGNAIITAADIFREHNAKLKDKGTIYITGVPITCTLNGFTRCRNAVLIRVCVKDVDLGVFTLISKGEGYSLKHKPNFTYIHACKLRN